MPNDSALPKEGTIDQTAHNCHSTPAVRKAPEDVDPLTGVSLRDERHWTSVYGKESRSQQRLEGWAVFVGIVVVVVLFGTAWQLLQGPLRHLVLALLGGLLGGLLQDAKFFYKSVGDGNWIWDKSWWRLLTPLLAGAMGFSVYAIFTGFGGGQAPPPGKEDYYAYGIGFLTGLFADNAIQKLRDIAYVVFGTPKDPPHRPHAHDKTKSSQVPASPPESGASNNDPEHEQSKEKANGGD